MSNQSKLSLQPIKGYIQEARTYLAYPFRPKNKDTRKFVILSMQRSGSSLLVSLLDSHPKIHCESELLFLRKMFPMHFLKCRSNLSPKTYFGFKLMPNHIGYQGIYDAEQFMAELHDSGYQTITLSRRNLLRATISLLIAQKRGKYHYNRSERAKGLHQVTLEPSEILNKINWFQQLSELQDVIVGSIPHLELVYEDHLLNSTDHQATADKIADFLGVVRAPVHSELARIGTDDLMEFVYNIDEIMENIQGTVAAKYM